jgi:hypothetical protein
MHVETLQQDNNYTSLRIADNDSENNTALTNIRKNGVFWDVTPCGSCNNRRLGGI